MRVRTAALILTLVLGLLTVSLPAEAQKAGKVYRIGLFHVGLDHVPPSVNSLRERLKELGYEEGKNIHLDWRNLADEEAARATAQKFVQDRVDLIVAFENQTGRAAKAATTEIPVVFVHVTDPVAEGLAKSLPHPGGNLTGLSSFSWDFPGKTLELLKELIPQLRRVLVLIDPEDPGTARWLRLARSAAATLRLELVEREVTNGPDIRRLLSTVNPGDVGGLTVISPNLRTKFPSLIIRLAAERRLPLPGHRKEWAEKGALFSYGPDFAAIGRAAARYVDKILKGTDPADLPVEQASRFELIINLKTAKALGLTIPPSVLMRADSVIE